MRIEIWSTISGGSTSYHVYFDEFDSLEEEVMKKKDSGIEDLVFHTSDVQVLTKKILKNVEKEIKHQLKHGI